MMALALPYCGARISEKTPSSAVGAVRITGLKHTLEVPYSHWHDWPHDPLTITGHKEATCHARLWVKAHFWPHDSNLARYER
jgi:hypothetical protein